MSWYCDHSDGDICRKLQILAEHCNRLKVPGHSDIFQHMGLGIYVGEKLAMEEK